MSLLAGGHSGRGSDLLQLLLDGGKVAQRLPAADGGRLLVECARPHLGDYVMFDNCALNVLKFTSRNFCQQTLHVELPPGNL